MTGNDLLPIFMLNAKKGSPAEISKATLFHFEQ